MILEVLHSVFGNFDTNLSLDLGRSTHGVFVGTRSLEIQGIKVEKSLD